MNWINRSSRLLLLFLLVISPIAAQESSDEQNDDQNTNEQMETGAPEAGFNMTIEIGAETFNEDGEQVTYQRLGLNPEFTFGKVGVGLGVTLHYRFVDDQGESTLDIREEDWIPNGDNSFLDIYLPLFRYVRYGQKGDPLYGKIGSIEDATLGTGFIMANYSNALFLPEKRIVGLALDVDGQLVGFPYLGIETFVGNLANLDVLGSRVYVRPLIDTGIPIIKNLQLGVTAAADTQPDANYDFYDETGTETIDPDAVSMFSFDFIQPLLSSQAFSMSLYSDAAFQPQPGGDELSQGLLVGMGGEALSFLSYGLNSLFLGDNFVPFYFDGTYDLYRQKKYEIYDGTKSVSGYAGWQAMLGFNLLSDSLVFQSSLGAAFDADPDSPSTMPHLRSTLKVGEGLLPGIFFDVTYDKKNISNIDELFSPEDAVVLANLNYKTGPAVITLGYTLRYKPETGSWETTAKLSSSITM
ncbi:MAG TPA: hypothetical protein VJ967_03525 [Clostridia bacterium]|nr:hypothetical protein [Clostridia bacterium]